MRTLAPQALSPGGRGTLQAEGLRIDYRPSMPFWSKEIVEPGKEMRAISLTFPDDGRIAKIDLCDRHGRPLAVNFAWYDEDEKNITCDYTFMVDAGEQVVQAVVTVWDGVEPCVIPLKMRIGLSGSHRREEKFPASKAPLPPNQAE